MSSNGAVLQRYFGQKPGQSMTEFLAEAKQLSESERRHLVNSILAEEVRATAAA